MSVRNVAFVLAVAAIGLSTAYAAGEAAPAPAEAASAALMPMDCGKQMARHDHGAEKGTPMPMSAKCAMASDAPADASAPKKTESIKGHDHARFHKLM